MFNQNKIPNVQSEYDTKCSIRIRYQMLNQNKIPKKGHTIPDIYDSGFSGVYVGNSDYPGSGCRFKIGNR